MVEPKLPQECSMWNILEVRFGAKRCSTWNMNASPLFGWGTGLGPRPRARRLVLANYSLIKLIRKCPTVTILPNIIVPRGTFGLLGITESMVTVNLTYKLLPLVHFHPQ